MDQPSDENHAVVVVEQSKGRTTSSSGWWIVLQQVVLASAGWSLLGMLAVFLLFLDDIGTEDDLALRLFFYGVTISILAPLGALFGLIGATRTLLLQKDGPVVRELDRRMSAFHKKKQKTTTTAAGLATPASSVSNSEATAEGDETEDERAARTLPLILNSLTFRSGFWCFRIIVGFFLPSSKVLFERLHMFRKKTSKFMDGPSTSVILVEFCDSYVQQWQYRLAMVGALLYGLCVLGAVLLLQMI
jgi:hypothetical protein